MSKQGQCYVYFVAVKTNSMVFSEQFGVSDVDTHSFDDQEAFNVYEVIFFLRAVIKSNLKKK